MEKLGLGKRMESVNKNISIFFNTRSGSGKCRGAQICKYINANANPADGYENDVCIWVKRPPYYPDTNVLVSKIPKHSYIDIVDGEKLLPFIRFKKAQAEAMYKAADLLTKKSIYKLTEKNMQQLVDCIIIIQKNNYVTRWKRSKKELLKFLDLTP